jgi:F-type H+-transporting ATPase subunit b
MNLKSVLVAAEGSFETHHWLLPETAEIIYGGLASLIVFGALYKFALPMFKTSLAARTERIQKELDDAKSQRENAENEAARIRTALGDIQAERAKLLAEADAQAATVLADGRARITAEAADLEAKAEADIAAASGRLNDEIKSEIARLSSVAVDRVVKAALNDAAQQDLLAGFISNVGAAR